MMSTDLKLDLLNDERVPALESLSLRMTDIDLTPLLVRAIDHVPAAALPWLAQQCNVAGPLWHYLPDDTARRQAIKDSVRWHRAKGTPWAVETALSWAGLAARVEDGTATARRWAEYQLEMSAPLEPARTAEVVALARFAAPARARLVRLYHGHDIRETVLDAARLDASQLDDDSGVMIAGIKCSFGTRRGVTVPDFAAAPIAARRVRVSSCIWDDNSLRLDAWRLDDEIVRDVSSGVYGLVSCVMPADIEPAPPARRIDSYRATLPADVESLATARRMRIAARPIERGWTGGWAGSWVADRPAAMPTECRSAALLDDAEPLAVRRIDSYRATLPADVESLAAAHCARVAARPIERGWNGSWAGSWLADVPACVPAIRFAAALDDDSEPVAVAATSSYRTALVADVESLAAAHCARAAARPIERGWTGRWINNWTEPCAVRMTTEVL